MPLSTPATCIASSRVGVRIKARGPGAGLPKRSARGTRKASVLPEPVGASMTTSRPAIRAGMASAWILTGTVMDWAARAPSVRGLTPASANDCNEIFSLGFLPLFWVLFFQRRSGPVARAGERTRAEQAHKAVGHGDSLPGLALLQQQVLKAARRDRQAERAQEDQVAHVDEQSRTEVAGRESADQVDAVVERRELDEGLEWGWIDADREEGRREEEEWQRHHDHQVEVLPFAHERRRNRADRGGAEADQCRGRECQEGPGRDHQAEAGHHDQKTE